MSSVQITEYLSVDLNTERWSCVVCGQDLGSAAGNYKEGCLVAARNPLEVHNPGVPYEPGGRAFGPDPEWVRIVEFYCPQCGTQVEVEYLPPGHPLTFDIELDIPALKRRFAGVAGGRSAPAGDRSEEGDA
jgi:acetone carboxylase gamma subunit